MREKILSQFLLLFVILVLGCGGAESTIDTTTQRASQVTNTQVTLQSTERVPAAPVEGEAQEVVRGEVAVAEDAGRYLEQAADPLFFLNGNIQGMRINIGSPHRGFIELQIDYFESARAYLQRREIQLSAFLSEFGYEHPAANTEVARAIIDVVQSCHESLVPIVEQFEAVIIPPEPLDPEMERPADPARGAALYAGTQWLSQCQEGFNSIQAYVPEHSSAWMPPEEVANCPPDPSLVAEMRGEAAATSGTSMSSYYSSYIAEWYRICAEGLDPLAPIVP